MEEGYVGPWVTMAAFAEQVLEEKDGRLSIIRVTDRIVARAASQGAAPPAQMPTVNYRLALVIILKPGSAKGRMAIAISVEGPDGVTRAGPVVPAQFDSEDRGQNIVLRMQSQFDREGLYWFNVRADERLLTRIPLRVTYEPMMIPPARPPQAS